MLQVVYLRKSRMTVIWVMVVMRVVLFLLRVVGVVHIPMRMFRIYTC